MTYIKMDVEKAETTVTREERKLCFHTNMYKMRHSCKGKDLTAMAEQPLAFPLCPLVGNFINSILNGSEFI